MYFTLDPFNRYSQKFLPRVVTGQETWIHYYRPEPKRQSKQWIFQGESTPTNAKTGTIGRQGHGYDIWVSEGIILMDYLEKERTITRQHYSELLLDRFDEKLKETQTHLEKSALSPRHRTSSLNHRGQIA